MINKQSHEFSYNLGITTLTTDINCTHYAYAITFIPKLHSNPYNYYVNTVYIIPSVTYYGCCLHITLAKHLQSMKILKLYPRCKCYNWKTYFIGTTSVVLLPLSLKEEVLVNTFKGLGVVQYYACLVWQFHKINDTC